MKIRSANRAALSLVALMLCAAIPAVSCPMCLGGRTISISAQELVYAARSVLALPDSNGTTFKVVEVIKGDTPNGTVISEKVLKADPINVRGSKLPLLLIRDDSWDNWVNFGPIDSARAPLLRKFAATTRTSEMDPAEWPSHVASFLPYLDSPEPMIATIADAELSSAPYSALRTLKPKLDAESLRKSLADPKLATREPLFIILLGISGDKQSARSFQKRIEQSRISKDSTSLGPLLAAMLEIRGNTYVSWIEKNYLLDPQRSAQELDAALLALGEHGKADDAVSRNRVVVAYRFFLSANPEKAGLVASLLADWQRWEFTTSFKSLIESRVTLPSSERYAVLDFILRSQQAAKN